MWRGILRQLRDRSRNSDHRQTLLGYPPKKCRRPNRSPCPVGRGPQVLDDFLYRNDIPDIDLDV